MTRRCACAIFALGASLWPAPGRADDRPPLGLELDARIAYARPFGRVTTIPGDSLQGTVTNAFPIWIDAGWRPSWGWFLGVYGSYGIALAAPDLKASNISTGADIRVGLEVIHHFLPEQAIDPWVGVGFGYEWLRFTNDGGPFGIRGWEFGCLQGGVDLPGLAGFRWGPMVAATVGQYDAAFTPPFGGGGPLDRASYHGWFVLGVRGSFAPARPLPPEPPDPPEDR
jgi:hypothetical protein